MAGSGGSGGSGGSPPRRYALTLPATTSAPSGPGATGRMRRKEDFCVQPVPRQQPLRPQRTTPSMGGADPPHTFLLWQGSWFPFCVQRKRQGENSVVLLPLSSRHIDPIQKVTGLESQAQIQAGCECQESGERTGLRDCMAPDGHCQSSEASSLLAAHPDSLPHSVPPAAATGRL